jgi:multidrug efflux pump subunit AcrA (membrane-fusion protein)
MDDVNPASAPDASWLQLELAVDRLHLAARAGLEVAEFYRRLLDEAAAALGAAGGAAWRRGAGGALELVCQSHPTDWQAEPAEPATRRAWIETAIAGGEAALYAPQAQQPSAGECLVSPVASPLAAAGAAARIAAFELWFPSGASTATREGQLDFAATMADVATDFHARDELQRLCAGGLMARQSVELLRQLHTARDLAAVAYSLVHEGRRLVGCDRLSLCLERGGRWRLAAVSGASRINASSGFAQHAERLAEQAARWGEPIEFPDDELMRDGLPPSVLAAIEEHVDHCHVRRMVCAPLALELRKDDGADARRPSPRNDAVLIAERFDGVADRDQSRRLVELGELCMPALARAVALDWFPIQMLQGLADALASATEPRRLRGRLAAAGVALAAAALLTFMPANFDVEAPATLATVVERDVFATATGSVTEVRVSHGQSVRAGDVLLVLDDPELSLKLQQVRGEIDASRRRLDALAVTRTDRTLRETPADDRLPLAAEQRQLEERLASLEAERQLLETQKDALVIRSPIDGEALTPDVQSLLESRPVERGQVLVTIADADSGWELRAQTPQRYVGRLLAAQAAEDAPLAASYRLAGDVSTTYSGHVTAIQSAVPLEASGLESASPPVEVRIAAEGAAPAAARPGMSASVRIHCGRRPLGYVWFYDVIATVYRWITF